MKYLRKFNESVLNDTTQDMLDLYISLIDKFDLTEGHSSNYSVVW